MAADDLPPGRLTKVRLSGRAVLVARLEDGSFAAAATACPHQAADLSGGTVYMGAVDCPLHHYLYDLRTGENRYPKNVFPADKAACLDPLPLYPVEVKDGSIWIDV